MKKISILFLILLCNCTFLYAQQFSITGVVTDKKLNEPIIGASVVVKGTTNGTVILRGRSRSAGGRHPAVQCVLRLLCRGQP